MELLRPILELGVVIPGMLLACFPVKSSLKQPLSKLVLWLAPLLALLCAAGGVVCYARRMPTAPVLAGLTLLAAVIYIRRRCPPDIGRQRRLFFCSFCGTRSVSASRYGSHRFPAASAVAYQAFAGSEYRNLHYFHTEK